MARKFCLLVPTRGDRPQFLALARKMIASQTLRPACTLIVDYPPTDRKMDLIPRVQAGLRKARELGFRHIAMWEDDEYYAPTYLETIDRRWPADHKIIGVQSLVYYHLRLRRWVTRYFPRHACLSCTAFDTSAFEGFRWPPAHRALLDVALWQWVKQSGAPHTLFAQPDGAPIVIGIKHGIGAGTAGAHTWPEYMWPHPDAGFLRQSVTPDMFAAYENIIGELYDKAPPCSEGSGR